MKILVTGGAGYIGSITVKALLAKGHKVVVFDNLSQGHEDAVETELVIGDLQEKTEIFDKLNQYQFDGVIHFAASTLAGESMKDPYVYFRNNIISGLNLLEFMREKKIFSLVFSSTCAIYGTPTALPVNESESKKPESVYGESKLAFEKILMWYDRIYAIKHINLRYFNASGASLDGSLGERHKQETHIIPIAIKAAIGNLPFKIYGNDYPTPDGSCIRDYIHVEDLAIVHMQALEKLLQTKESNSYNLGTGNGYSNLEVVKMVKKISGKEFPLIVEPRRKGDPAMIYADNSKAKRELEFNPKYSDLETIIKTAWEWHNKQNT